VYELIFNQMDTLICHLVHFLIAKNTCFLRAQITATIHLFL
jgi:hypothetical protein